ncbi:MAG: glycoside hydrolase family 31 protein [Terriglobales bacterium]
MKAFTRLLLALLCCLPAWGQWIPIGDMPAGQTLPAGVEYRNPQGLVRLTVIEAGVIRVQFIPAPELGPEGEPRAERSFALISGAAAPPPAFTFLPGAASDTLRTAELTVTITRQPFRLRFADSAGRLLDADAADGMAYDPADAAAGGGARVRVWKQLSDDVHFFGLGEKTGPLDKRGEKLGGNDYVMWNSDVFGYDNSTDPLYADIPLLLVLQPSAGGAALAHGIFFDNTYRASFDLGKTSRAFYDFGAEGGQLNYYVIAGPTPADVLRRYAALTGRIPLPPLWSLGYNQCRYSYYPAAQVLDIAEHFRRLHIPADAMWLDIAYMRGYRIFTWDPAGFPHPRQLLRRLRQMGFHAVSIIDPGVKDEPGYPVYDSGVAAGAFVREPAGGLFVGPVWPGPAVFPDFTSASARAWWAKQIAGFAAAGLSGIWNDMNEPSVFEVASGTMPDDVVFHHDGRTITAAEAHNVFGQQMSRATQQGLLELAPDRRPFVLTRDTYAGGQRYAALWTGDNTADWGHFRNGITTLLGMGLSGFPWVGNDIGGFAGVSSADLWTRWAEAAAFFPFMRGHANKGTPAKEPWAFGPAHTAENRLAIARRYEFLPYIYNVFYRSSRSGLPMMRALLLDFPNDPRTYNIADEFLFGRDLLVAPIVEPEAVSRSVYLPAGTWYRLSEDAAPVAVSGPADIRAAADEGELPLFARDGAILFRSPAVENTAAWQTAPLIFEIFSQGPTSRTYYEDDGATFAYRRGEYFRRTISYVPGARETMIQLAAAEGAFRPRHSEIDIELQAPARPKSVALNGRRLPASAVAYSAQRRELTIRIPRDAAAETIRIGW